MKPRALGLTLLSLILGGTPAIADTVELKNGRRIEGKIVSRSASAVRIQVEGGCIDLPRVQIAEITDAPTPDEEYGDRFQEVPLDDPGAIDALATWARSKGLEEHARQLKELARGVRLEQAFESAGVQGTVDAYVRLEAWSRQEGFSFEVRRLALTRAQKLDPGNLLVRRGLEAIEGEEKVAALALAAARARPTRLEPVTSRPGAAERERDLAERERAIAERERLERERAATGTGEESRKDGYLLWPRGRGRLRDRDGEEGTAEEDRLRDKGTPRAPVPSPTPAPPAPPAVRTPVAGPAPAVRTTDTQGR